MKTAVLSDGGWGTALALALLLLVGSARGQVPQAQAPEQPTDIPFKHLDNGDLQLGDIVIHRQVHQLSFPARFRIESGIVEVVVSTPEGRLHEALLVTDVKPVQLQALLFLLGLHNGPRLPDPTGFRGDLVDIEVAWTDDRGEDHRDPVEDWLKDTRTGAPMDGCGWAFVGSGIKDGRFLADIAGNLIINYSVGETILDIAHPDGLDDTMHVVNDEKIIPAKHRDVRVYIVPRTKAGEP